MPPLYQPRRRSSSWWDRMQQRTGWPFDLGLTLLIVVGPPLIYLAIHWYCAAVIFGGEFIRAHKP